MPWWEGGGEGGQVARVAPSIVGNASPDLYNPQAHSFSGAIPRSHALIPALPPAHSGAAPIIQHKPPQRLGAVTA